MWHDFIIDIKIIHAFQKVESNNCLLRQVKGHIVKMHSGSLGIIVEKIYQAIDLP